MISHLKGLSRQTCVLYLDKKGGEYQYGTPARTYSEIQTLTDKRPYCVRVVKPNAEAVDWVCQYAMELSTEGPLIVAVDEMQSYSNKNKNAAGFELIQDEGGFRRVSLIGTTHRPGDVHGSIVASCDRIIVFQTHHSKDVDKLQDYIDVPREAFMGLKLDEYIEWTNGKGYKIVRRKD